MKFDDLDQKMRLFEELNDQYVLPHIYIVTRLDGRSFTRLTKEVHQFEAPYNINFRDYMIETVKYLMNCGFRMLYGYTQSDEISLLFHPDEDSFQRKIRKLNSILAGEASAKLSLMLKDIACFDCRTSQLPNIKLVVDYFRWRNEDAHRNALNSHCYWLLRKKGEKATAAANLLNKKSVAEKNELLFQHGINFNDLPDWQKRGAGLYWELYEKEGFNPKLNQTVKTERRRIMVDLELPMRDEYSDFIRKVIGSSIA
jgi:tRNA(His) guanylyltransferase